MIKKLILFLLSFLVLFAIAYAVHFYALDTSKIVLRFSLLQVYVFHTILSFIICAVFVLLSGSKKWSSQLGFIYIFTFVTKFAFFAIVFKNSIFEIEKLTRIESLNLLIPVFLFLFLEVYFIAKILNQK